MASLNVLTFDAESRAVDFEVWLDDQQLFLQCDSKEGLSLFDLTSGASTAPTADADSTVRSQWLTRDAAARLAVRNHLPSTEHAHFSQYKSARALYDAVVARYSSPTTAALSRLMLPYLFPDLAVFSTVADLVSHLRTSDARYRAALPTEFLPTNSPPMYITLYYLVTRLPDSLSSVRDHFLSLCPTELTVDLLEERLTTAEKSILAGSLHEEIWLRRPPGFTGSFPAGTQWSLRRPVYGLRQAPREWHDTLRTTLAALGFAPSTADPSLFLRTDTTLPPFYVLVYVDDLVFATADTEALAHVKAQRTITLTQSHMVQQVLQRFGFTYSSPQSTPLPTGHSLSAPPSDESVEPSGPYPELVGCLMYLMTCTRPDLAYPLSLLARYVAPGNHRKVHWDAAKRVLRYLCSTSGMGLVLGGRARVVLTGHADASWVDDLATQRSSQGYTFSLGSGSVSWRSTRSSSVLSSSCEAEIYAGAMAAQELRWLTYLLTDLGEVPRSPPVLYVNNKAMLALCQEHRLEHRTKHIALRYFLARELQQRGQLRLAYVASQANTADVFTKALQPCDHQPCFAFLDWSCDLLFSPTLPMGETLLEEVNGECGGANREEVVPDYAKGVREPGDYVVESEVERGRVSGTKLSRKRSAVASVTSAEVRNEVAASSQVFTAASGSGPESAPCSCRLLSHQTLLWHHRLGHPSLPRLRGMASRVLVSGLPRSVPPLPPGPAPTCVPCVEGRQRAAPHSSEFPPTEAPLQTLHMDVWGPARVRGQGHERYFLLVVDDYSRYTTVFPLRSKGEFTEVLIDWIRATRLRLRESFGSDFPVLRLHSDRGGEFSSAHLGAFCRAQGIRQTFTLPASPQRNGIAERRIGMVMDVARTSMIHAAAPHFLWPFAVQYAAHQLNLQPRISLPETSHTLRWTGKVGDASAFRVWGSRAFVRDLSADKLSPRATPCVFLGFPPDAPGWQFYHPTSRRVLSSQDVTFDESVPYYRPPPVDPLPPQGHAPSGVSQVDAVEPVEVAVDSGAASGAKPAGAESGGAVLGGAVCVGAELGGAPSGGPEPGGTGSGGAEHGGAELGGTEPGGAEPGGAEPGTTEPGGAEPGGAGSALLASRSASSRRELLSPQELRESFARRWSRAAGAGGTTAAACSGGTCPGGAEAAGPGGAAEDAGVGPAGGSAGAFGGTVGATGAGVAAGAGAAAGSPGAVPAGSGGATRSRPYFVPLLEQVLGLPPSPGPPPPFECPPPVQTQSQLQPVSPLPAPSPYTGPTGGLAEHRAPASRPASPARTALTSHRTSHLRPPAVPGTHQMALRPSTAPLRVPLPSPPASSLPVLADPASDSLRVASPSVARLLATVVTDPSLESTDASALVTELVDFAARCRLDYATSLVAESARVCPPSVGGECALSTDVLEDRQEEFQCFAAALPHLVSTLIAPEGDPDAPDIPTPRSYAEAIEGPYSSQWQAAMDAEMASWKSTGTYVDEVPPPGANIVSGMWIFRVKRPPGSPPVFKARYVARGFSQRQGVYYFQCQTYML
ncbi:unnamed protein product [Closterium sp. NIES-53]